MEATRKGGSIPKHLSLVPLWPERQAALQAIIDVEDTAPYRRNTWYLYAKAFFRRLTGRGKVNGKALRSVVGVLWDLRTG
jgi:hypothetical protein